MAEKVPPMAASPLHEQEEASGEPGATAESSLVETEKKEFFETAAVETEVPVESGPVETAAVEEAKPVEESPQEENDEEEAKRKAFKVEQERLKKGIMDDIEKRVLAKEQDEMTKEDVRPEVKEVQPPVAPPEEHGAAAATQAGLPPFNVFNPPAAPEAVGTLQVKEEEFEDSDQKETDSSLVVQDLRMCSACHSKSYIRQGLCINIYCSLYYMNRPDSGTRLCARGKLSEGKKWSPKEWVESGQYGKIEEQLLTDEWNEAIAAVEGLPPPEKKSLMPAKLVSKEPILIEDIETGEVFSNQEASASKPDATPDAAADGGANPENDETMEKAIIAASRRVRNKGWKRVRALAEKISEKKMRGEWSGPDVPMPSFASKYLAESAFKAQDKAYPTRDWTSDDWKKKKW